LKILEFSKDFENFCGFQTVVANPDPAV
jgi:hypothetical protein